jgi:hypothetical protein
MKSTIDPSELDSNIQQTSETTWIITLEEDPETGDLIMPLPDKLLEAQGWKIGDTLTWDVNDQTGTATLTKKD